MMKYNILTADVVGSGVLGSIPGSLVFTRHPFLYTSIEEWHQSLYYKTTSLKGKHRNFEVSTLKFYKIKRRNKDFLPCP